MNLLASSAVSSAAGFGPAAATLIAWAPIAVAIVKLVGRPGRGLIAAAVFGWLFLPQTAIVTPFVIFDKSVALETGLLLAMLVCHPRALRFRLRWIDLPMLLWCLVPAASAIANGLSPYDAAAAAAKRTLDWGVPYFLGRGYLTTWADARDLAAGVFLGGVAYVPLCLAESFLSPFLHHSVYGIYQHESGIDQAFRDGGWRPMVFLQHGLAVGMYMAAASLTGAWLWWSGALRRFGRLPVIVPLLALWATTAQLKSLGALVMLPIGLAALYVTKATGRRGLLLVLLVLPGVYVTSRATTSWNGDNVIAYVHRFFGEDRAHSLAYRLYNERAYLDHDRAKPLLGYGPGPGFEVYDGEEPVVVDSLWIIIISIDGAVGIAALMGSFALPLAALLWRVPARQYAQPAFAGVVALAVVVLLYGLDNLVNAMFNPIFMVALGCVGALSEAPLPAGGVGRRRKLVSRRPPPGPPPPRALTQPLEDVDRVLAAGTIPLDGR